ncbi:hypothetical protein PIB30_015173 [Stylosanthes scabra]|uniref:PB1 domain-containing protein n=1 Tax=Stylosanthes scabra TaxID=79078 RepID=A0ABU6T779_9FABA|nr:hypothetical protein [Stylosanthes scabra]
MTSHPLHPSCDFDTDSVASSPRSDHFHDTPHPQRVRFMCSFGGKILPRPHDNQLRYVGGDTRIVAVNRSISFPAFLLKLSKLSGMTNITAKYQLPNEDLDALISVTTDEDVENMMDEYDRIAHNQNPRSARLRLFLFPESSAADDISFAGSIGSLLNGSVKRESWFLDALNGGVSALERGRSEASSMVSEVPDYLFGLDNSEETPSNRELRHKDRPGLYSDPGSPAPVASHFSSTSSVPCVPSIPNLPPVKTKLANPAPEVESKEIQIEAEPGPPPQPQPNTYPGNTVMHYAADASYPGHSVQPVPVYYFPGPVQPGTLPVHMQAPYPYVQQPYHHAVVPGQVPVSYHQLVPGSGQTYGTGLRHVSPVNHAYSTSAMAAVGQDGVKQQVYQAVPGSGYPAMAMTGGDEPQRGGSEFVSGRVTNSLNE